jgi:hypothetical protein
MFKTVQRSPNSGLADEKSGEHDGGTIDIRQTAQHVQGSEAVPVIAHGPSRHRGRLAMTAPRTLIVALAATVVALGSAPISTAARPGDGTILGCGILVDAAHPWHSYVPGGNVETGDHWITARSGPLSSCEFTHLAIHRLLALSARTYHGRDAGRLLGGACDWTEGAHHERDPTVRRNHVSSADTSTPAHRRCHRPRVRRPGSDVHPLSGCLTDHRRGRRMGSAAMAADSGPGPAHDYVAS